jgi:hypothetical protein
MDSHLETTPPLIYKEVNSSTLNNNTLPEIPILKSSMNRDLEIKKQNQKEHQIFSKYIQRKQKVI